MQTPMISPPKTPADTVLARFPKIRPELPAAYREIYSEHYRTNRQGGSPASFLAQGLESWMHRRVAASGSPGPTLELGAGTLNQLPYEQPNPDYDVVEPFADLYRDSPHLTRVRNIYRDIEDAPADARYARITSVAVLEHIEDLPRTLAQSALLLQEDGVFAAAIPSEGGFLWRLGWTLTTGLEFRLRRRLDYGVLMQHEHVNTAREIEVLIREVFSEVKVRSLGMGHQLSFYRFIEARGPRADVASAWLQKELR